MYTPRTIGGDGFHRYQAASLIGKERIEADVRQGMRRDAVLFSVGANATHGLRRTSADKRRAVETMLRDEEWVKWTDLEIACRCAVDNRWVGKMRLELSLANPMIASPNRFFQRNGVVYTMNTANIGRSSTPPPAPEGDAPISDPDVPQIAIEMEEDEDDYAPLIDQPPTPEPDPPATEPVSIATLIYAGTGLAASKPARTLFQVTPSGRLAEVSAPMPTDYNW